MKKIRGLLVDAYRLIAVLGVAFTAWKIVRHWHAGFAEKTGHTIDTSVRAAAEQLEKTAIALEEWADRGRGENLGKSVDEVLMDTKTTLDLANDLVQHALAFTK